ncbi:uncharacterized protein LOC113791253 [Dermatophagoides pteronyssinus]|uniref:uncharacterized protein LOC113791253 n=1 Tax=Dermatophagoides pteronyssinus TaxID=6956 RepID=UPI003F670EE5
MNELYNNVQFSSIIFTIIMIIDYCSFIQSYNNNNIDKNLTNHDKNGFHPSQSMKTNSFNCSQSIYKEFSQCQTLSQKKWNILRNDYLTKTKKFCCFIWDAMDCQSKVAAICSKEYSKQIVQSTKEQFETMCKQIGSAYNSWSCKMAIEIKILIIIGTIFIILTMFCLIIRFVYGKNYNVESHSVDKCSKKIITDKSINNELSLPTTTTKTTTEMSS